MRHFDPASLRKAAQPLGYRPDLPLSLLPPSPELDEGRFRTILDSVPEIVWSCSSDGSQRYYNRQWYDLTGTAADEDHQSVRWLELVHPDDRESVLQARETGEVTGVYEVEHRLRLGSGEYRWFLTQGRPTFGPDGKILWWYGTCVDVHERVLAQQALNVREARFRAILDGLPHMVWTNDDAGKQTYYNKRWYEFTGLPVGSADEVRRASLIHPDDASRAMARWQQSLASGEPYECTYRLRHHSGAFRWIKSRARREQASGNLSWYGTTSDIHEHVLAEKALSASEALNRSIIAASADSITMLDLEGRIAFMNETVLRECEIDSPSQLLHADWAGTFPPRSRQAARRALAAARAGGRGHFSTMRETVEGTRCWYDVLVTPVLEGDCITGLLVTSRNMTRQKAVEEQARWAANHDDLTSLPNRALFRKRLRDAVRRARKGGGKVGLLMLDLDGFKQINDTLGHDAGDRLLCNFADRLRSATAGEHLVARLGGDEFAIVVDSLTTPAEMDILADRVLARLRQPYVHEGRVLDCRATIGGSVYPDKAQHRVELLKQADMALYMAKSSGRGRMLMFEPSMRGALQARGSMLALAKNALEHNLILPYYQPKLDLRSGEVAGFEALLRWRHPRRGVQLPATIAAAFEDLDLAAAISDRMIEKVIADMRGWIERGIEFHHVAINASAAEFRQGHFAERLLEQLAWAEVPTHCLQLEVTETVFLGRGAEFVEDALKQLSASGVKIALDDFGTGYASLSHLKQFPVDVIKIDRSFVRDLQEDVDDAAIVRAVIQLGQSLGIEVVAEGVESPTQHGFLVALGCEYGQGYLYGKAQPAKQVSAILANKARGLGKEWRE